jgi:parallel beta-helix repeat protein
MVIMRSAFALILVGILLVGFTLIQPIKICEASGNTIYVDDSGGANYTTIKEAIEAAYSGDTIYVYNGIYNENFEISKSLTLTGENRENTIINGAATGNIVKITANYVNISGFTIQNPVGSEMKCIMMDGAANCKITNNIIKNSYDGIYILGSNGNSLIGNTIKDNDGYGIFVYSSSNNILENNQIQYDQYGIGIDTNSNNNVIFNNDIRGKQGAYPQGIGIYIIRASTSGNLIYHNYLNDFAQNAKDLSTENLWYKISTNEGNYWDDYQGEDENQNGIGDTPYNITADGSVQDIRPLGYFEGVNQPPVAIIESISPNPATQGQTVYFSGHGTDDGTIVDWEWKSNINGVLSSSDVFNLASLSVGIHTISFRVKDDVGVWSNPDYETLMINPSGSQQNQNPTAQIVTVSPNPATYGDPVYLHGLGMDNGVIVAYNWRSDIDGFLNGSSTFTKSDLSVGTHAIYFKVRDNMDEWSYEVSASLVINPGSSPSDGPPTADAGGPYLGYANSTISFDGSGSSDDEEITYYLWDFGDETTTIEMSPTHTYTKAGNYTVTLTVRDSSGKTDIDTTYANISIQTNNGNNKGTPGFEIITFIISITLILLWRKRRL